jgi:hypothetical protein
MGGSTKEGKGAARHGHGLTFDVTEWQQGSLSIEPTKELSSSSSSSSPYTLFFHSPYRSYSLHAAPMQETTVDVTELADSLMKSAEVSEPLWLTGRQALMAFQKNVPLVGSLLLLPETVAAAVTPVTAAPWLSPHLGHGGSRRGGGRG